MSKIAEFLTRFDDQHLANLQCAAEDGTLVYHDCNRCLLHHFKGNYTATKWEDAEAPLAKDAETEYRLLGPYQDFAPFVEHVENVRRQAILPLIHAEWARRIREKIAQEINAIEEFAQVSPSVR